jgi:hypothetical protein
VSRVYFMILVIATAGIESAVSLLGRARFLPRSTPGLTRGAARLPRDVLRLLEEPLMKEQETRSRW